MNAGVWRKMSLYLRKIHTDFGISLYYKKEGNAIGNWNFIQKIQKQYDALIGREVEGTEINCGIRRKVLTFSAGTGIIYK